MRTFLVNHSDMAGGAARAAYRVHHALRQSNVDSTMLVNKALADDWTVIGPVGEFSRAFAWVRGPVGLLVSKVLKTSNQVMHSPAILPSGKVTKLNSSDVDLLHLHWINHEMLSIEDIGHIQKPIIWTVHDMWPFCGAEHYTSDFRWLEGYSRQNRPAYESGVDLNRWVWRRKRKSWRKPIQMVAPSRWLADCIRQSALMHDWPVSVIPNAIDTDIWKPLDKSIARALLNLPQDVPIVLFGALGGGANPRKGFDLLRSALQHLLGHIGELHLVIFGQNIPRVPDDLGFPVHYVGHLHDDLTLRVLYSTANVLVIPSRQDNLPNTGVESMACGTPVVAFNVCGMPDIICHQHTGYLADAFDAEDLAKGIFWVLEDSDRQKELAENSRNYAVSKFSYPVVAGRYIQVYQSVIASS